MNIIDQLRHGLTTASPEESRAVAEAFARALPPDTTLALHGNLGVGKTTFVQGLARGFGIQETVTSPTFTIYNVHRGPERTLIHLDAYRLENARQIEDRPARRFPRHTVVPRRRVARKDRRSTRSRHAPPRTRHRRRSTPHDSPAHLDRRDVINAPGHGVL